MDLSSDALLLSTKLKIPAPRKNYVARRALFEKLSQCADMGVIFVCGGAGTGKTTLLSSFFKEARLKNVCWVTLDATNVNVYPFWLYFTAALSAFLDDGDRFLSLIRSNPSGANMENLLTLLINRLCGDEDYYMVLDDVHCIQDAALIGSLEFFIGAMPANFHFFMLSREDPPVYLGPLAMSGRLLYIGGKQMQLTPEEGMSFLKGTLHLSGSDEELARLNDYAEGWVGGLQLAAAAGAVGKNLGQLLRAGGGIAAEYLNREIIESLTAQEKDFLLKTCFLSYFDAQICAALLDGFPKSSFDRMIENLIQRNLFIICMDEAAGIYRYHNILSDYLTQQFKKLPERERKTLFQKAARAFERAGDLEEALHEYCEAECYEEVLRVADSMDGRVEEWRYLDKVPLDLLIQNADLAAQCFMYNIGNLNVDRCRALFDKFKETYGDSDVFRIVQFAESYLGKGDHILPHYYTLSAEQIDRLPFGPVARSMALVENSAALVESMRYEEAAACIDKALQACAGVNTFAEFFAYTQQAQILEETGDLNASLACYARADKLLDSPSVEAWFGMNYHVGLAGVYMRQMELDKADEALEKVWVVLESQHKHFDVTDLTLAYRR